MMLRWIAVVLVASVLGVPSLAGALTEVEVGRLSETAVFDNPADSGAALEALVKRGNPDVVASLIVGLRYRRDEGAILDALSALTGTAITDWSDAMLWQEAHPDVVPHASYQNLKVKIFARIDPNFLRFLGGTRANRDNLDIRLEEIVWGGVPVDGIPSLDNPDMIAADAADYLFEDDLVFGIEINGDVRAYPLRIMGWHEMFNDTIGGVPVALAYCTLCGAAILFETRVEGRDAPLVFGSSGFLYRSNKLMFDRATDSLWNQFTGKPISGPLRNSGIELAIRPVVTTTWSDWRARYPETTVLSAQTGFIRDYGSGVVYKDYFASPDLMFPTIVADESVVKRKDRVFGIRQPLAARAWPIKVFRDTRVINDAVGARPVVLVGDASTRSVRAYDRGEQTFEAVDGATLRDTAGGVWSVSEAALLGPDGTRLARVPGHLSYWFAWNGYLGVDSTLYSAE